MKVAIISVNIWKYIEYWKDFYLSAEENFLPECVKDYYVFTDAESIEFESNDNVHIIHQKDLGWPGNSMKHFGMFLRIREDISAHDYIFYINSNILFNRILHETVIRPERNIIVLENYGVHGDPIESLRFEENIRSRAYISPDVYHRYVLGGFIGGKSFSFIELCETLDKLIEADLKEGIIARAHDESFLNKYVTGRTDVQCLGWQYVGFELYILPYDPPFLLRRKTVGILESKRKEKDKLLVKYGKYLIALRNIKWLVLIKLGIYKKTDIQDNNGKYIDNDVFYDTYPSPLWRS